MVHALEEIRRVLVATGTLIDLRPISDTLPVAVVSSRGPQEAGSVTPLPEDLADDAAANHAMRIGERAGIFHREREEFFTFDYTWDSPSEMQEFVEKEWANFARIDEPVWKRIRSLWAVADADALVRVQMRMIITRWGTGED